MFRPYVRHCKRAADEKESHGVALHHITQAWVQLYIGGWYFKVTVLLMSSYVLRITNEIIALYKACVS